MMTVLPENISKSVHILRDGGLVAFPTETVYGLGADARNEEALRKIFKVKERPADHPLIVHIPDASQLGEWAEAVPESALKLTQAFWPGPLTIVLKKKEGVSSVLTGGYDTVALRSPNHPVAQNLLYAYDNGLAAPSANKFTRISPTTASAVFEELGDEVDMILDGGPCKVGLESTIIDLSQAKPIILRPGMISQQQIEAVLGEPVAMAASKKEKKHVPGSHELHYAAKTPTRLIQTNDIADYIQALEPADLPVVCLAYSKTTFPQVALVDWVDMLPEAHEYAHELYRTMRALDTEGYKQILIEKVPEDEAWLAIRDRLARATETKA